MTKRIRVKSVGDRLRYFRKEAGLTQGNLADKLGILTSTVAEIENDNTQLSIERLIQVCNIFKITPNAFFNIHDEPEVLHHKPFRDLIPKINTLTTKDLNLLTDLAKRFIKN